MNKLIILAMVLVAGGLLTAKALDDFERSESNCCQVTQFDTKTTELAVKYRCFKNTLETTLRALRQDHVSVSEAVRRVHDAANRFCPIYLERVRYSDPADSLEESIEQNLQGHLCESLP